MMQVDDPIRWPVRGLKTRYRIENRLNRGLVTAAPWINMALLVIFYLLLKLPFVQQPGVMINLPRTPYATGTPYGHRIALVSQESADAGARQEIAFFDDERLLLGDPVEFMRLRTKLVAAARDKPAAALIIEADKRIAHGTVVDIFNAAADAGIREINIATRPIQ